MVYDTFLVTAVVMLALFLFLLVAKRFDPMVEYYGRTIVLVAASAAYFIWCWTSSGHTLAMKTWRIKLVKVGSATVPFRAAFVRYVFAWGWVLPGLLACWALGLSAKADTAKVAIIICANIVAWAMTALLDRDRQFLHDRLAGTRLISLPKQALIARKSAA